MPKHQKLIRLDHGCHIRSKVLRVQRLPGVLTKSFNTMCQKHLVITCKLLCVYSCFFVETKVKTIP